MMIKKITFQILCCVSVFSACTNNVAQQQSSEVESSTSRVANYEEKEQTLAAIPFKDSINTKNIQPENLIQFAKTLIGVPYKYGSTDVNVGFDCSGFITYVFNHFDIAVPRSSVDFTHVSTEVNISNSKPGDLILFTGTDSAKRVVGHMGIITQTTDTIKFIHSTSGKAYAVTETPLNKYYQGRFVKTIRIFK